MNIIYNSENKTFHIQTENTSYVMGIYKEKYLLHLYYGKQIDEYGKVEENFPINKEMAFSAMDIPEAEASTDVLPMEYPCYGSADLRTPAFHAAYENGSEITVLEYSGYNIFNGKKELSGLPSTYVENESEAITLEIILCDKLTGLEIALSYTIFDGFDAIAKSVNLKNKGVQNIKIKSALSSTTYLFDKEFDFVHLQGGWARERDIQKKPLINGSMQIESKRVSSSHHHSPFLALARPYATETQGDVYGFSLIYSGNHIEQAEVNSVDLVRVNVGINPMTFSWLLEPNQEFQTPEVILTYSDEGFGKMSRTYHNLYRNRLCRGKYRDIERPVLINNWEATYFKFNEEKIIKIAQKAKSVGVELMVLDDGWFGRRNDVDCSVGDWVVDYNKLPNGIEGLADKIEKIGMKFGLWFEPEMVSEDSDLYRCHPDWCIHTPGRRKNQCRNQFVLDLSRKDVRDHIVNSVSRVLSSAPISYVKWDMNRNISELGSSQLSPERQQEVAHRYVLGVYDILERITTAFPDILFEGCSGGGGRFDAGMLYYFPQYWTSDNSDAIERLYIQHGTSMVMPSVTMGAHVSAVPNHQVSRTTSIETRGYVAMAGQFGYELDLGTLSNDELEIVKGQIKTYKSIRNIVHYGDMYRLKSPFEGRNAAWEFIKDDTVVLIYCTILARWGLPKTCVKFCGLDPSAMYKEKFTGKIYSGKYLMNVGLYFEDKMDFQSKLLILKKVI